MSRANEEWSKEVLDTRLKAAQEGKSGSPDEMRLLAELYRRKPKETFWDRIYSRIEQVLGIIDLNMVRAGAVRHPAEWKHGGYGEIQEPPDRYRLIDLATLSALCGFSNVTDFQVEHRQWVNSALRTGALARDDRWSESVAVGSEQFVGRVKTELGNAVGRRQISAENKTYSLRESSAPYNHLFEGNNEALSQNNAYLWDTILDRPNT